ncbi:hypothetical protein [Palaeococcus ferrophilus]|uniref:hypothetical protein n=1 Tax=Palaeococcus ferrophilus TaxID=83868 RepID=UPI00064E65FD|nr:hypothetical protein [Palaeococcus ferrophilus]
MKVHRVILAIIVAMLFPNLLEIKIYGWLIAPILVFVVPWLFVWAFFDDVDELKASIARRVRSLKHTKSQATILAGTITQLVRAVDSCQWL